MGQRLAHVLLAQAQEAHQPAAFTSGDLVRFLAVLLLAAALLVLVLNSWRICNLLAEIRDLLRRGGGESPAGPGPQEPRRPPT
jgi:hypothetical protein